MIEGFKVNGLTKSLTSPVELKILFMKQEKALEIAGAFNPKDIIDAEKRKQRYNKYKRWLVKISIWLGLMA